MSDIKKLKGEELSEEKLFEEAKKEARYVKIMYLLLFKVDIMPENLYASEVDDDSVKFTE